MFVLRGAAQYEQEWRRATKKKKENNTEEVVAHVDPILGLYSFFILFLDTCLFYYLRIDALQGHMGDFNVFVLYTMGYYHRLGGKLEHWNGVGW